MIINQEYLKKLNEFLEVKNNLGFYSSDESANIENNINYLEKKIKKEYAEEIIKLAYKNQDKTYNGVVFINLKNGELEGYKLTSNTIIEDESLFKIYELNSNWINNNNWRSIDIISDEEQRQLKSKFDKVDFLSKKQLKSINVDLDKRLKEYLKWIIS